MDKAVELADKASPGERLLILAVKATNDGNDVQFKKYLDELLAMFPNDKRARMMMGGYYGGGGDLKNAAEWYQKSTEADPTFAPAYNLLGYARKMLGDYKGAETAFKKYTEVAPSTPNPPDSYAELLLKIGRFDESIQWYQKAWKLDPKFTGALGGVALNYVHKGDFTKARETYEEQNKQATQVNGKLAALANIVYSFVHQWDIPGALKALERYRALAEKENPPSVITSYFLAGYINGESGNIAAAQKNVDQAKEANKTISLTPAARSANDLGLDILQCYVFMRGKNLDAAKKHAEACAKATKERNITAEQRTLDLMLGNLECELGNYDRALAHLDKGPVDNPFVMFSKAVVYERKGDVANAKEWYKKAAHWNWTGLQYALVRSRAMKKSI